MHRIRWSVAALAAVVLAGPLLHRARADCPSASGCLMARYIEYELQPPQPCLAMHLGEDDCRCLAWIAMENNCQVPLVPQDFTFAECNVAGQYYQGDCPSQVGTGDWGNFYLPPEDVGQAGHYQQDFHLELGGQDYTLAVSYDLVELNTGCGCGGNAGRAGWPPALLALLLLGGRRLSANRHAHRG